MLRVVPAVARASGARGPELSGAATIDGARVRPVMWNALGAAAMISVAFGVAAVRQTDIGSDPAAALAGIGSQIGETLPAALRVIAAAAANLAVGAIAIRLVRGRPFTGWTEALLLGFAGSVVVDVATLGVLGSLGWYSGPVLVALHVLALQAGWMFARPFVVRAPRRGARPPAVAWVFAAVLWAAPLGVQLASPVIPFHDVLHNHVAPVQHVRTYASFTSLDTTPAPETGPSRQVLGYLGFVAALCVTSWLAAPLAAAAVAGVIGILLAVSVHRTTEGWFGPGAGWWGIVLLPTTFVFLRLADSRATVAVVPIVLMALMGLPDPPSVRRDLTAAVLIGSALLVHPLMGAFGAGAYAALGWWSAAHPAPGAANAFSAPALAGGIALASPELLTVAGVGLPSWTVVATLPLAAATVIVVRRIPGPHARTAGAVALAAAGLGFLWQAARIVDVGASIARDWVRLYPLSVAGLGVALALPELRPARSRIVAVLAVGFAAAVVGAFLPDTTIAWQGTRGEIAGKTAQYWTPTFLALATAGALAGLWRRGGRRPAYAAAAAAFVLVAAVPLDRPVAGFEANEEHRFGEVVSIALNRAERGAWVNWPDWRRVVDTKRAALLDAIRVEQRAGRLGPHDRVLHVASTWRTWVATPVAAFTGVIATNLSKEAQPSPHTLGGRLYDVRELGSFLRRRYPYVILEPHDLPPETRDRIVAVGYRTIFANEQAELFTSA